MNVALICEWRYLPCHQQTGLAEPYKDWKSLINFCFSSTSIHAYTVLLFQHSWKIDIGTGSKAQRQKDVFFFGFCFCISCNWPKHYVRLELMILEDHKVKSLQRTSLGLVSCLYENLTVETRIGRVWQTLWFSSTSMSIFTFSTKWNTCI